MGIIADKRFHVEDFAQQPGPDRPTDRGEIGIPAPVLVHGEHAIMSGRGRDDPVRLGQGETEGLLACHVLAGP